MNDGIQNSAADLISVLRLDLNYNCSLKLFFQKRQNSILYGHIKSVEY